MSNKRIVVKVGSSTLTDGASHLSKPSMLELVRQIASLQGQGYQMVLVTSGAMAAGRDHLNHPKLPPSLPVKQMLCAVGQSQLMQLYSELFGLYGVKVGQVLVTGEDLRRNRVRYLNTRDTLEMLLSYEILPIVNENDTVAVEEIKVGDNDNLSALVASLINADALILLTDRDGLYNKDPQQFSDAQRIHLVERLDADVLGFAKRSSSSGLGVGGMHTKLQAAEIAGRSGIETLIAHGKMENILPRLLAGEDLGTRILPSAPRQESRKRWLASEPVRGWVVVDAGATKALRQGESSLLPVGIKGVQGKFERGETVEIRDLKGGVIGRGQVNYGSTELSLLCGVKSPQIVDILGYTYGDAAVHRDNLVLLQVEKDAND